MKSKSKISINEIIARLRKLSNTEAVAGMARFGINPHQTLGVSVCILRAMAKELGKDHKLAQQLWDSKIHEARILAGFIDEPDKVTSTQMEEWAGDFDSWDVCDQVCGNLFDRTSFAYAKALAWSKRKEEFVKRAGFVLMAVLSVHDKQAVDAEFEQFFSLIKNEATDERNFVKKAVNWALRQIGKRNINLNKKAIKTAREIEKIDSRSARWIAKDAIRELIKKRPIIAKKG